MRKIIGIMILLTVALSGCKSDREQLEEVCAEVKSAQELTHDCSVMAERLAPQTKKFNEIISHLNETAPDEQTRVEYVDVVSKCLRAYMEISVGTCGNDEAVQKVIPK